MIFLLLFSLLAGFVTVTSPCILPVLPILFAAGVGGNKNRYFGIIIGLISSFIFFTLSLKFIISKTSVSPDFLRNLALIIISFFGLTMIFPKLGNIFQKTSTLGNLLQSKSNSSKSNFINGLIFGIALSLSWTPCAGPVLATVITLAATNSVNLAAFLILLFYSIGSTIPMFLIMYGGNKIINSINLFSRYTETIQKLFGGLMILGALAIFFHFDVKLQQFTFKYFHGIFIEENKTLKKELQNLKPAEKAKEESQNQTLAPEIEGITNWINSSPLFLKELKGKIVLIDFWSYNCIHCVNSIPHLKKWYETYKDKGLVIIGIHSPMSEIAKNISNVQDAVKRFEISYPVAVDNEFIMWQKYNNESWPTLYLIDKEGIIKEKIVGSGQEEKLEEEIKKLL